MATGDDLLKVVEEVKEALAKVGAGLEADRRVLWNRGEHYMIAGPETKAALAVLHGQAEGWLSALVAGVEGLIKELADEQTTCHQAIEAGNEETQRANKAEADLAALRASQSAVRAEEREKCAAFLRIEALGLENAALLNSDDLQVQQSYERRAFGFREAAAWLDRILPDAAPASPGAECVWQITKYRSFKPACQHGTGVGFPGWSTESPFPCCPFCGKSLRPVPADQTGEKGGGR